MSLDQDSVKPLSEVFSCCSTTEKTADFQTALLLRDTQWFKTSLLFFQ